MAITAEAFREVFAAHYDDLTRFVRRRIEPDHAEDVVEEAFLALWRQRDMPTEARPWLFATARNLMLSADRGRRRRDALAVRIAGTTRSESPDHAEDADLRLDLETAWRQLNAADQEVLALSLWEDLSAADAAVVLGCSKPAYLMRLSRAKTRIAPLLRRTRALTDR